VDVPLIEGRLRLPARRPGRRRQTPPRPGKPRFHPAPRCSALGAGWNAWDTGFVDLDGDQGLLGQREGRTGAAVVDWLAERSPQFREGIEYVAIDPAAVYASAIRTEGLLPNATIVVDHFHPVKLANDALTNVRRRVEFTKLQATDLSDIIPDLGHYSVIAIVASR
jgi:transposase